MKAVLNTASVTSTQAGSSRTNSLQQQAAAVPPVSMQQKSQQHSSSAQAVVSIGMVDVLTIAYRYKPPIFNGLLWSYDRL